MIHINESVGIEKSIRKFSALAFETILGVISQKIRKKTVCKSVTASSSVSLK
jgi:hypothetical protein